MMGRGLGHYRIVEKVGEGGWVRSIALQMKRKDARGRAGLRIPSRP